MNQDKKSRLIALGVTILVHLLLALLLWLMHFTLTHAPEESGVLVMVGVDAQGGGNELMSSDVTDLEATPEPEDIAPAPQPVATPAPPTPDPAPAVITQDDAEAPYAAEQLKREQAEREAKLLAEAQAEKQRQEELRKQQEEEAKRRAEEEARRKAEEERKQQESQRISNQLGGLFNNHGTGGESGVQGQTNGNSLEGEASGNPGYGEYDLGGRGIVGSLPRPTYNSNISGKVVVNIFVNEKGEVTSANVGQGTTISDPQLRQYALDAAKRAKFKPSNSITPGKITYTFDSNH